MHKKKFLRRVLHGMHTAVSIHLCWFKKTKEKAAEADRQNIKRSVQQQQQQQQKKQLRKL